MANWEHTLTNGTILRDAIMREDEDYNLIFDALIMVWKEIHKIIPDDFDDFDLEDALDEIACVREDDCIGDEDIDALLSELYDFCDEHRLWVAL